MRLPRPDEAEAFKRLATRPEGQLFVAYLTEIHESARDQLENHQDAVQMRILQGSARVLHGLLKVWKP